MNVRMYVRNAYCMPRFFFLPYTHPLANGSVLECSVRDASASLPVPCAADDAALTTCPFIFMLRTQ